MVLCYRQRGRRRQRSRTEVDPELMEPSFQPNAFSTFSTNPPPHPDTSNDWSPTTLLPEDPNFQRSEISPTFIAPKYIISSATTRIPTSSVAAASASQSILSRKLPQPEEEMIVHAAVTSSTEMPMIAGASMRTHPTEDIQGLPTSLPPEGVDLENNISPSLKPPNSGLSSATADVPTPTGAPSQDSSLSQPSEAEAVAHAFTVMDRAGSSSMMGSRLTDEQSELVQGLMRHNVPLPAVVVAIEGMLRRDGLSGSGEGSGSRNMQRDGDLEGGNPPEYDG